MGMVIYSSLLTLALAVSAPWWGWHMLRGDRYRQGLAQRLGRVPPALRAAIAGRRVIWLHAVSVGEVLAAERLIHELETALGPGWIVVISTTTATGQQVARQRFTPDRVFFLPLDFAWTIRLYLRALNPALVLLMESELWPRLIHECHRAHIPLAVLNARISDRSFPRYMRLRRLWCPLLNRVTLFLAQGPETAARLTALGVDPQRIHVPGNLKYDLLPVSLESAPPNPVADWIRTLAHGRKVIVAGSTLPAKRIHDLSEEEMLIQAFEGDLQNSGTLLVLAPRHPPRFPEVEQLASNLTILKATQRPPTKPPIPQPPKPLVSQPTTPVVSDPTRKSGAPSQAVSSLEVGSYAPEVDPPNPQIILLDTIGDLAAVYQIADVAFLGGSLVPRGGHNPLEAARFAVPIVMGPSYANFREIVEGMRAADAIRIISSPDDLAPTLLNLLQNGKPMGERARIFFQSQTGATARTVALLVPLVPHA